MTREEFIDMICQRVYLNGKLPQTLGEENIESIMEFDALPYFYRNYYHALRLTHYYVDLMSMRKNNNTDTRIIQLPKEIESIRWIYLVNYRDMTDLGYMFSQNNMALGATTSPYVSHLSVSDWGVATSVMQSVSDALSTFSKNTVQFDFDPNSKMLEILTSLNYNMVLQVHARIPEEYLFEDPYFIKYVLGTAMMDYVIDMNFLDTNLSGGAKINSERMYDRGEKYVEEVKEYMDKLNKIGYFISRTR